MTAKLDVRGTRYALMHTTGRNIYSKYNILLVLQGMLLLRSFSPNQFNLAETNFIAYLNPCFFECSVNTHLSKRHLQSVHAFFALHFGHVYCLLVAITFHYINSLLYCYL